MRVIEWTYGAVAPEIVSSGRTIFNWSVQPLQLTPGPFRAVACEILVPGLVAGEALIPGAAQAEVLVPGAEASEADGLC